MRMSDYDALPSMVSTSPFAASDFAAQCITPLVLDIGCGYGRILDQLASLGLRPIGADLSMVQLQRCRPVHRGRVVMADATRLPFADRTFGGALALGVIDSFTQESQVMSMLHECARVLAPGAPLWLNFYTVTVQFQLEQRYGELDPENPHMIRTKSGLTVRHWTVEELQGLLTPDFSISNIKATRFLSMNHAKQVSGAQMQASRSGHHDS